MRAKLENMPVGVKVTALVVVTSVVSLLLALGVLAVYDHVSFRQVVVQHMSTSARIVADASSVALSNGDEREARRIVQSLRTSPHIVVAALYDRQGNMLARYPATSKLDNFPAHPQTEETEIRNGRLHLFEPVMKDGEDYGVLYLRSDLSVLHRRVRVYVTMALAVLLGSVLAAVLMAQSLQKRVTRPILSLANMARDVSRRGDYSLRAVPAGQNEIGELTNSFNQMLTQIQDQTRAIHQNQDELRLALAASRTGIWEWNPDVNVVHWDQTVQELFGGPRGDFHGTYEDLLGRIYPADRMAVSYAITDALDKHGEFVAEFRCQPPNGPVRYLMTRGKVFGDPKGKTTRVVGVISDSTATIQAEATRSFLVAMVQSSDAAIIGTDLRGKIISWNTGAEHMYGYTAAEIIGQRETSLVPEQLKEDEQQRLESALKGVRRTYESVRMTKSGKRMEVSVNLFPIDNGRGEIIGASSITRDITARKAADRELVESRARLSGIINSAMDAIISVDASQRVKLFNKAAERMFRCRASDIVGKPLDLLIPMRHRSAHHQHVEEFGRTGTTSRAMGDLRPLTALRSDGEEFPIEASISQIDVAGERVYTVILRDITERHRVQTELEKQANTLREQAELLDLGNVMTRDMDGRVVHWSKGMENLYGWTSQEAVGQKADELLRTVFPESREAVEEALAREGSWEGELIHNRKDGSRLYVASKWVMHRDSLGKPIAILEVNTDISERKAAEEQIVQLNEDLERRVNERTAALQSLNKELESFTYSVAHDLRAPIRHIDAFSGILHDDFGSRLPPEASEYVDAICTSSRNMSRLVEDLLNLARVRRQEMRRQTVDMNDLVDTIIGDLRQDLGKRKVEWRIGNLPEVEGDPGLLRQVFTNLLSNAVKYTSTRDVAIIEAGSFQRDSETVFFVRDNGVGFDMKYAHKLFGVFQRLHRAEDFEGTGVGLAIVQRIVQKHGGRIWAEAAPDQGASFFLTLGRTAETPPPSKDEEQSHAA